MCTLRRIVFGLVFTKFYFTSKLRLCQQWFYQMATYVYGQPFLYNKVKHAHMVATCDMALTS